MVPARARVEADVSEFTSPIGRGRRERSGEGLQTNERPVQVQNQVQSAALNRYPIPVSVRTNCGRSGSASILCLSCRTYTRRYCASVSSSQSSFNRNLWV